MNATARLEAQTKSLAALLTRYRFPIIVGAGAAELWKIEDAEDSEAVAVGDSGLHPDYFYVATQNAGGDSRGWDQEIKDLMHFFVVRGIPVINPCALLRQFVKRDDFHCADSRSNRNLQALLFTTPQSSRSGTKGWKRFECSRREYGEEPKTVGHLLMQKDNLQKKCKQWWSRQPGEQKLCIDQFC